MPHSTRRHSTWSRAHAAVVDVLVAARDEAQLTQRELADRLPAWLGISHVTLAKIEGGYRTVTFVEAREIAGAAGLTVWELDRRPVELMEARQVRRRKK